MKPAHYRGTYHRRSMAVRDAAYADPDTRCGRCGFRLNEGPHHKPGRERWEAGHVVDGQVGGPLRPEARSCNRRAAAERTNAKHRSKSTNRDHYSRPW